MKGKILTLLKERLRDCIFFSVWCKERLKKKIQKVHNTNGKISTLDFMKHENFCSSKDNMTKRVKGES